MNLIKSNWQLTALGLALALATVGLTVQTASAGNLAETKKVPLPRPRPVTLAAKYPVAAGFVAPLASTLTPAKPIVHNVKLPPNRPTIGEQGLSAYAQANVGLRGALFASRATFQ